MIFHSLGPIIWVDATSVGTIRSSLVTAASSGNSGSEYSAESTLQLISGLKQDWFLIFDNADGDPEIVEKYTPPGNRGNILFTSRNPLMRRMAQHNIEIAEMREDEAVTLLLKAACLDSTSDALRHGSRPIVTQLGCLALAVEQAGSSIASGVCNIQDYLQRYSVHRKDLMACHPRFRGASERDRAVYGTWELSFKVIETAASEDSHLMSTRAAETAISILGVFAFLHHTDISEEMFRQAAASPTWKERQGRPKSAYTSPSTSEHMPSLPHWLTILEGSSGWDIHWFREGIRILRHFSLVKQDSVSNSYTIHPLVHAWSRDRMEHLEQEQHSLLSRAILLSAIPSTDTAESYAHRRDLTPHVQASHALMTECNIYQLGMGGDVLLFGSVLHENGRWDEAVEFYRRAIGGFTAMHGAEHHTTLKSMSGLANAYRNQGLWDEAEDLDTRVLEICERRLGHRNLETVACMANLAATYCAQGRWKAPEYLQNQVLEIRKRVLGAEHPITLSSMAALALTYWNQGRWKEAKKLQTRVLEIHKRELGLKHPDTLTSMFNLASTLWELGKWDEARELEIKTLKIRKSVLSAEHPHTLASMSRVAYIFSKSSRWNEADELTIQVLEIRERVLGAEHPETLWSMASLSESYLGQDRWEEAEELGTRVVEISQRVLGTEDLDTLTRMANLAEIFYEQERWNEAGELQAQVLKIRQRILGAEHHKTLKSMYDLAYTLKALHQDAEALRLMKKTVFLRLKVLGKYEPDTTSSIETLQEWQVPGGGVRLSQAPFRSEETDAMVE